MHTVIIRDLGTMAIERMHRDILESRQFDGTTMEEMGRSLYGTKSKRSWMP